MTFEYPVGATPLDPEEEQGLLITHITTKGELDSWEQENILEASRWAASGRKKNVLTVEFIRDLHRRMFGNVWRWAGEYRTTGKNIGVPADQINLPAKVCCTSITRPSNRVTVSGC